MRSRGVLLFDFYDGPQDPVVEEKARFGLLVDTALLHGASLKLALAGYGINNGGPTKDTIVRIRQGGTLIGLDGTEVGRVVYADGYTAAIPFELTVTVPMPDGIGVFTVTTEGEDSSVSDIGNISVIAEGV